MDSPPTIKHILLYASLRPGSLMLAECADGTLRLLRDERSVDGAEWQTDQVQEAAAAFHRMAAEAQGKGN